MKSRTQITFGIILIIFVSLACAIGGQPTEESEISIENSVATSVASTLAAGELSPEATLAAVESPPTETTEPTITPPSILRVAYIQAGNVWLWTEGVGAVQLTHGGQAVDVKISDDGLVVAFEKEFSYSEYELWAVNSDGTNERSLFDLNDFAALLLMDGAIGTAAYQVDWVPGTHTLAFNTRPLFEGPGLISDNNLHLIDADTMEHTELLPNGQGGMFYYSPDGTHIAIVTPESINLVNADGLLRREMISYPNIYTYSEYAYYPTPLWLPDSSALMVAIPPQDPLGDVSAPTALWRLPVDGTAAVLVQNVVTAPFFISPVTFSPDGSQFIHLTHIGDETSNRRNLHITALDGSSTSIYASGEIWFSGWSPDSSHFAYSLGTPTNMQLGAVGSGSGPLTDTAIVTDVFWVSENDILFEAGGSGNWEIRYGIPGGASVQVAYLGDEFPTFDFAW